MPTSQIDVERLKHLLSVERLKALIELTGSDQKAVEIHQDTLRLGGTLMTTIATLEIALRNSVYSNLALYFGVKDWLLRPPVPFQWQKQEFGKVTQALDNAKRSEYSKLSQSGKHALDAAAYPVGRPINTSHLTRSKERRKHIPVTDGKVVAELTFYFWKRLYGPEYEHTLWKTSLKRTFPHKKVSRATVAIHLENIYQTRNRLAHHEPVVRKRIWTFSQPRNSISRLSQKSKHTRAIKMMHNPIIFVRHGETDWNRQGLIQGSVETDLNETGHAQAKSVAATLAQQDIRWAEYRIVVSPQRRALQTAAYILNALGRDVDAVDPRVRELGFGIWEGKPFWELKASPVYPADAEGRFFWRPELGESYEDGVARVNDWRSELTCPTLVIAHGAVGRCLMGTVAGLGPAELVMLPTPQGKFCVLEKGCLLWFDGSPVAA